MPKKSKSKMKPHVPAKVKDPIPPSKHKLQRAPNPEKEVAKKPVKRYQRTK